MAVLLKAVSLTAWVPGCPSGAWLDSRGRPHAGQSVLRMGSQGSIERVGHVSKRS